MADSIRPLELCRSCSFVYRKSIRGNQQPTYRSNCSGCDEDMATQDITFSFPVCGSFFAGIHNKVYKTAVGSKLPIAKRLYTEPNIPQDLYEVTYGPLDALDTFMKQPLSS